MPTFLRAAARQRRSKRGAAIAENWYVPGRLTPEMNRLLDTTTTPFGRVVQALEPYRRTFASKMLWSSAASPSPPEALFEHRAVLYTRDNKPFSEVYEIYQRDLLAFLPGSAAISIPSAARAPIGGCARSRRGDRL
jgi:hypothetical protein